MPTDTMRNTIYGLAQEHLTEDLEAFATALAGHFLAKKMVDSVEITLKEIRWTRHFDTGFLGGGSEKRVAAVTASESSRTVSAGIEGLVVLKTRGSAFVGFPKDQFTILPEADDRLLATSVTATWTYSRSHQTPRRLGSRSDRCSSTSSLASGRHRSSTRGTRWVRPSSPRCLRSMRSAFTFPTNIICLST